MVPSAQPFNFFHSFEVASAAKALAGPINLADNPKRILEQLSNAIADVQSQCAQEVKQRTGRGVHQVLAMREAVDGMRPVDITVPGRLMPIGQKATAVIYDTETGDLSARKVVEWASVKLELEQRTDKANNAQVYARLWPPLLLHLPKPDVISPRAASINHYTNDCYKQLKQRGVIKSWPEAATLILNDLASADLAVAHNAHFDLHALKQSLQEEGLASQAAQVDSLLQRKWACTSSMAWACLRNWRENYFEQNREVLKEQGLKRQSSYLSYHVNTHPVPYFGTNLGNLYKHFFGHRLENAHSAAADVYGASAIFLRLLAEGVNPYVIFKERHDSFSDSDSPNTDENALKRPRSASDVDVAAQRRKRQQLGARHIQASEVNNVLIGEELKKYVVKLADHDRRHIIAKSEIEAFIVKAVQALGYETVKNTLESIPGYVDYEKAMRDPALEQLALQKGLVDFSNPIIKNKRLFLPIMWMRFNLFIGSGPENRLAGRIMHGIRNGRADKRGSVKLQTEDALLEDITNCAAHTVAQRLELVRDLDAWIKGLKYCLPDHEDRDMVIEVLGYDETEARPSDNIDESLIVADRMRETLAEIRQAAFSELEHLAKSPVDEEIFKKAARTWVKNIYDNAAFDLSQARIPQIRQLQHERLIPLYQNIHQHIDSHSSELANLTVDVLKDVVTSLFELDREAVRWGQANADIINSYFQTPIRSLTLEDLHETDQATLREAGRAYGRMIGVGTGDEAMVDKLVNDGEGLQHPFWQRVNNVVDGLFTRFNNWR